MIVNNAEYEPLVLEDAGLTTHSHVYLIFQIGVESDHRDLHGP
jgi:hypothetical protein